MSALTDLYRADLTAGRVPEGVPAMTARLRKRFGDSVLAVLLYGSCRRGENAREGLADLLILVTGYRAVHGRLSTAVANRLLPPNVYYLEVEENGYCYRCKYAVVSLAEFSRRCAHGLDAYFRARFLQPAVLAWAADPDVTEQIARARAAGARKFTHSAVGLLPPDRYPAVAFWAHALARSYRCELRAEPPATAERLVAHDAAFWSGLAAMLAGEVEGLAAGADGTLEIRCSRLRRLAARTEWCLRSAWGKALSLARLFKAAGTFTGGLDYLLWKVERHSGVRVEASQRMRRYPRLAAWRLAWRLWRRGGFQ